MRREEKGRDEQEHPADRPRDEGSGAAGLDVAHETTRDREEPEDNEVSFGRKKHDENARDR